ncbi:MAG: LacI family transcriptional regulator [Oscillospiraceae bacterium]|nr:LacI family transcriptional regulator [Oscillospiraceae bacterium]
MKVTLSDIAKQEGVTPATVQRALKGSPGVSERKRRDILRTAARMGYNKDIRRNFRRIAVLFPRWTEANRYYPNYIWQGIDQYAAEAGENFEILKSYYEHLDSESQLQALRELLSTQHGRLDGLVTIGSHKPEIVAALRAFEEKEIPVSLMGVDGEGGRICCVRLDYELSGHMAADLLIGFGAIQNHSRIIVCGYFMGVSQYNNSQAFERRIWESGLHLDILKIDNDQDPAIVKSRMEDALKYDPGVSAIYSTSSRATIPMCEAVREMGLTGKIKTIGSDIFPESVRLLQNNELSAIIYNRHTLIARQSVEVLDRYLAGKEIPCANILMPSVVVTASNAEHYIKADGIPCNA